jgi:aminopeptidase N
MMRRMPGTNLTRDEAATRSAILSVATYEVVLDLSESEKPDTTTFASSTVITFDAEPGSSTFADLVAGEVSAITLNGTDLDPARVWADARIRLDGLAAHNELRVTARCLFSHSGEGLHRSVDPTDGNVYLYTQFEVPDARQVYATFEQPDLKAEFDFSVVAPSSWQVVSNAPTPEPTRVDDLVSRWDFPRTKRISTYITAIIAGPYHVVRDSYASQYGDIPLGIFCRQSLAQHLDTDDILEITKQGFAFFEKTFAMGYPFDKYDQLFVPEYNAGAMENAGAVTFRDEYIFRSRTTDAAYEARANTILHEMAHMWFGDLVTMKWWDDLWLNESFAEWASHYASAEATRYTESWTTFCNQRKVWAYRQDQLPSTHPIAADMVDFDAVAVNFDGITYAKGASALRQLVAWVGEEKFVVGLRRYFTKHAWRNTSLDDLLVELEEASGRDLKAWTKEWLQTAGVNTLRADFDVAPDGTYSRFEVVQTATADWPTLRSHRIGIGAYRLTDGVLARDEVFETDIVGARTSIPALVGVPQPDLLLLNDSDLSYTKIRLDTRSQQALIDHIDSIPDSLARALCWSAAWDMTRDAEMRATDFVALVLRGIGTEADITAVQSLLRFGASALQRFSHPDHRQSLVADWEAGVARLVHSAEPGSDHQLAFVRSYAAAADSAEAVATIAGWLDGKDVPAGLTVDTDMRWALLTSLARLGKVGDAEIDAELDQDDTVQGAEKAALARAAQPTVAAKAQAWDLAVTRDDTPNQTQRQICAGFWQHGQDDLLSPYVDAYLDEAPTVWDRKGTFMATTVLIYLFPGRVDRPTLAKVDAFLADTQLGDATRRYIGEGRDDLARALAAQDFDAS